MKKIMIDMDDVICIGGFLALINEFLGTSYKEEDFKNLYMQEVISDKEAFFKFFFTKNQYDYCHLSPNVVEVIEELNKHYEVYIGTSYIYKEAVADSGVVLLHKYEFLQKTFPFLSQYRYIFLGVKSVLDMDIKIDDRLDNLEGARQKLLFTAYHNKDMSDELLKEEGAIRVNSWLDIKKVLIDDLNE